VEPATSAADALLTAAAVRQRCHRLLALGLDGKLQHFSVELDRLDAAADLVIDCTRRNYPQFDVPFHSRWRHFTVDGEDQWGRLAAAVAWRDRAERARAAFDLAILSVLLDAGADARWRYRDPNTGRSFARSEGLALASLAMFAAGGASQDPGKPLCVDASALRAMTPDTLGRHFQVSDANPLPDLVGRLTLLRRLGEVVAANPGVFARAGAPRPGGLFDYLVETAESRSIAAPRVLSEILRQLGPIWPGRLKLAGVCLGDCWHHPAIETDDSTSGLVPLHKLSQWLAYSLIEPLQAAGFGVTDIDGLTGLAEYRNGGLMLDTGVLALRDPAAKNFAHDVGATLVVEWRALTVALLDRLAESVRQRLGADRDALPLVRLLQGGTWAAGRQIAACKRADAGPPLSVLGDGTVF
jgi:Protein of unknown function (DUF1688)